MHAEYPSTKVMVRVAVSVSMSAGSVVSVRRVMVTAGEGECVVTYRR